MTFVIVMGFHQIIVVMNDVKRHTYNGVTCCSFSGVVEDRKEERGVIYGMPKRYLLLSRKNNTFSKYKTFFIKNKLSFRKNNDFTKNTQLLEWT